MFSRLGIFLRFVAPGSANPEQSHAPPGLLSRLDKLPRAAKPIADRARNGRRRKERKNGANSASREAGAGYTASDDVHNGPSSPPPSTAAESASVASVSFMSADTQQADRTHRIAEEDRPSLSTVSSQPETEAQTPTSATPDAPPGAFPAEEEDFPLDLGEDVQAALMFMNSDPSEAGMRYSIATVRGVGLNNALNATPRPELGAKQGQAPDAALLRRPEGKAAVAILTALESRQAPAPQATYEDISLAVRPFAQLPPLDTALRLQALAT